MVFLIDQTMQAPWPMIPLQPPRRWAEDYESDKASAGWKRDVYIGRVTEDPFKDQFAVCAV
jgi:hypothetical protein